MSQNNGYNLQFVSKNQVMHTGEIPKIFKVTYYRKIHMQKNEHIYYTR